MYIKNLGHMTKMAAIPIYGKNPSKIFFSETNGLISISNWQMDRILIILKKENGPRASSAPALGLKTIIFKLVYWYMQQISGERLQDHWSSGFIVQLSLSLRTKILCISGVTINDLAPMKNCPGCGGVQDRPN